MSRDESFLDERHPTVPDPRTAEERLLTVEVVVRIEHLTPEGVIANWWKLTKEQLIDTLCVYHEGLAQATAALATPPEPET